MNRWFAVSAILAVFLGVPAIAGYASDMDDRIESAAEGSYVFMTFLKGDDVEVESEEGVVTLTGTVSDESHKKLAEDTVSELPGVKEVVNKIEVEPESPSEGSDAWLAAKVKLTLLFHRSVSASDTYVDVEDGVVTLSGEAETRAQRDLTTEYAKDVGGVKGVVNRMTVTGEGEGVFQKMGEKIDDASITAQVKMALLLNGSTSALDTEVVTYHGVVTLSGKAGNDAEKALATKIAEDVSGVKEVVNEMEVVE